MLVKLFLSLIFSDFIVRESESNPGTFVISIKYGDSVIHQPVGVHPLESGRYDAVYSIDNGRTVFGKIELLIQFYQLNSSFLPVALSNCLMVRVNRRNDCGSKSV